MDLSLVHLCGPYNTQISTFIITTSPLIGDNNKNIGDNVILECIITILSENIIITLEYIIQYNIT